MFGLRTISRDYCLSVDFTKMDRFAKHWRLVLAGFLLLVTAPTVNSLAKISGVDLDPNSKTIPMDMEYDDNYILVIRRQNEIITSTLTRTGHYKEITMTVFAFNETFILDLQLNTYLFSGSYIQKSKTDSEEIYHNFNHTEDHCHYIGKVRDNDDSIAAISTCNGISGFFSTGKISLHIESHGDDFSGPHKVFRIRNGVVIHYEDGEGDVPKGSQNVGGGYRVKRSAFDWPQEVDGTIRIIEVYVVVSYEEYASLGKSESKAIDHAKAMVNLGSIRYQSLGLYLVIVGVEVWTSKELITVDHSNANSLLDKFNAYRQTHINPLHDQDVAILLMASLFQDGVVGMAPMSGICSDSRAAMFACDIAGQVSHGAEVMSHELGHNLGFKHDDEECACDAPNGAHCIMWPSGNPSIPHTKWSQCSKQYLADSFQKGVGACLKNIPDITTDRNTSVCGNGIVEADEQCDCGNLDKKLCNSACCDPKTCKLVDSATCASGKCCDAATCQMKQKWTECRANSGECDLPEFCDGISPYCPADTYKPDGMECTNGVDSYCYKGQCNSHRSQCILFWGKGAKESDSLCYELANIEGGLAGGGDCGIDYKNNAEVKLCQPSDMMCGRLLCDLPYADFPLLSEFGLHSFDGFRNTGSSCDDYGMGAIDLGLVPNGAKCDEGKMCVNQRCVDVNSVLQSSCSPECKPNEVCNNLNKCQSTSPDLDL